MEFYKLISAILIICIISVHTSPMVSYSSSSSNSMNTNINGVSSSVSSVIMNGKYTIIFNNGDCIYKQGKIIENDNIRSMTDEENQKMQKHLNGEAALPCFCAKC
uniref:Uncharacterized protein n=1 Tax=Panagrolaimus sp. ES5 TaxID=591445 RepID=A0AC34GVK9_9BILA